MKCMLSSSDRKISWKLGAGEYHKVTVAADSPAPGKGFSNVSVGTLHWQGSVSLGKFLQLCFRDIQQFCSSKEKLP